MKTKTNACRNWTFVALAGAFGLAGILVAGGSGHGSDLPMTIQPNDPRLVPAEDRVSRALFDALHERTVDSFSKSIGFGHSRIGHGPREHIGVEQLWTILPPESAGYEVALIGLENDPQGTVYSVEVVEDEAVDFESELPVPKVKPEVQSYTQIAEAAPNSSQDITVGNIIVTELSNPLRKVEHQLASDTDREMLDLLNRDDEAPMLVDGTGERVMIYGSVRANQQRCITCHQCEPGTLLGAFRYVFDMPTENGSEVAVR